MPDAEPTSTISSTFQSSDRLQRSGLQLLLYSKQNVQSLAVSKCTVSSISASIPYSLSNSSELPREQACQGQCPQMKIQGHPRSRHSSVVSGAKLVSLDLMAYISLPRNSSLSSKPPTWSESCFALIPAKGVRDQFRGTKAQASI